jgi:hypothetical protein
MHRRCRFCGVVRASTSTAVGVHPLCGACVPRHRPPPPIRLSPLCRRLRRCPRAHPLPAIDGAVAARTTPPHRAEEGAACAADGVTKQRAGENARNAVRGHAHRAARTRAARGMRRAARAAACALPADAPPPCVSRRRLSLTGHDTSRGADARLRGTNNLRRNSASVFERRALRQLQCRRRRVPRRGALQPPGHILYTRAGARSAAESGAARRRRPDPPWRASPTCTVLLSRR